MIGEEKAFLDSLGSTANQTWSYFLAPLCLGPRQTVERVSIRGSRCRALRGGMPSISRPMRALEIQRQSPPANESDSMKLSIAKREGLDYRKLLKEVLHRHRPSRI